MWEIPGSERMREMNDNTAKLLTLVQTAACTCLPLYKSGSSILAAHTKAEQIFAKEKKSMPHGLGHGIGLDIHEYPFVAKKASADDKFRPGMIVTLEPGLYDPELGGSQISRSRASLTVMISRLLKMAALAADRCDAMKEIFS